MKKFNSQGKSKIKIKELITYLQMLQNEDPEIEINISAEESNEENILLKLIFLIIDNDDG
jgi:hypothetical protein